MSVPSRSVLNEKQRRLNVCKSLKGEHVDIDLDETQYNNINELVLRKTFHPEKDCIKPQPKPKSETSDWPTDIVNTDIQRFLYQYFNSSISNKPKYLDLIGKGNRCIATNTPLLSLPQTIVYFIMKGIARNMYSTTNRGLLVWHSTGSGKLCTATAVMDAFWDNKDTHIIYVTSVEASNSNPPSNFHECASRFLPRFLGKDKHQIKQSFEKRKVMFMTFAQIAHYLMIAKGLKSVKTEKDIQKHKTLLNDAILIIDEVHNIFKPLPNQKEENDALRKFLLDEHNPNTKFLKIVILTATPGETSTDIVALLNMVRDKNKPMIQVPNVFDKKSLSGFENDIRGLISYFDMSKDYTKFPKVFEEQPMRLPISQKQFVKYVESYNEEKRDDYEALKNRGQVNKYMKQPRKYSNMLYEIENDMKTEEFSSKLPALLDNIQKHPDEKHYIYSAFYERRGFGGQGILGIAKVLEEQLGYTKANVADVDKLKDKRKRYVLAISSELSDDIQRTKLKKLVQAFNTKENAKGEYIHLFLATQGYFEGIDLKAVRHIHIFEPLLSFSSIQQLLGRAARHCSHADLDLDKGEWTVRVHRYITDQPQDMSVFNLHYFKDRIEYMKTEILHLENQMKETKTNKEPLKNEITFYKTQLKELSRKEKDIEKMNLQNVKMIDDKITAETYERAKEMLILQNSMKKSAIDYLLLKDFHET